MLCTCAPVSTSPPPATTTFSIAWLVVVQLILGYTLIIKILDDLRQRAAPTPEASWPTSKGWSSATVERQMHWVRMVQTMFSIEVETMQCRGEELDCRIS
jgi:hypothetical protein